MSIELMNLAWIVLMSLLGLALPIGIGMLASRSWEKDDQVTGRLLLAGLLALLVSFACGFSLQYGGIGLPQLGQQPQHDWQWTPFGEGSGLLAWAGLGLPGTGLSGPGTPGHQALFLLQSLGAASVVVIALAPTSRRLPAPGLVGGAVFISGILYPLLGHWIWGQGWLAASGRTAYLGHGYVDYAGAGPYYALGGLLALAGLLATRTRRQIPSGETAPRPLLPGALLALLGITALNAAAAWEIIPRIGLVVVNTWASAAAAGLVAAVYMAFTTTRLHGDMLARGLVAGATASAGIAPFAPPTTLLIVGAGAGLLATLGSYLLERVWHLDDRAGIVPTFGLGGLWGILAVGLFADGTFGQGLNGVGSGRYLGVLDQGVSGITLLAAGIVPDFGQLTAQVLGLGTILVWALLPGWLIFRLGSVRTRPEKDRADRAEEQSVEQEP